MDSSGAGPASTITRNEQLFVFPEASVAVTFTEFSPTENALPEGGLTSRLASEQLSAALGVNWTVTGHPPAAVTTMFVGQVTVGASVSLTITVNEQVASGGTPLVAVTTTVFV